MTLQLIDVSLEVGQFLGVLNRPAVQLFFDGRDLRAQRVGLEFDVFLCGLGDAQRSASFIYYCTRSDQIFRFADSFFSVSDGCATAIEREIDFLQTDEVADVSHWLHSHCINSGTLSRLRRDSAPTVTVCSRDEGSR